MKFRFRDVLRFIAECPARWYEGEEGVRYVGFDDLPLLVREDGGLSHAGFGINVRRYGFFRRRRIRRALAERQLPIKPRRP